MSSATPATPEAASALRVRVTVVSHTYAVALNRQKLDRLAALGFALQVIVPRRRHEPLREIYVERRAWEPYALLDLPTWPNHPNALMYAPRALTRALSAFRPHIIQIEEEPHSLAMAQVLLALSALPRSIRLVSFTWRNVEERYPPPFSLVERWADRRVDRVIVGNEDARRLVLARGVPPERVVKIPQLGVDLATFHPRARSLEEPGGPERPLHVGYIGRLAPEKGVDTLLRAVRDTNPAICLTVRGAGPGRDRLVALAAELGLMEKVNFLPGVPHDEVAALMQEFDVLVLPSRTTANWKEQFGHVLIEAMACGVPVIGSDSGAIPEVIGDAGLIFPEDDAAALAGLLRRLLTDRGLREELSACGLARVTMLYQQEAVARQTANVYAELLGLIGGRRAEMVTGQPHD